MFFGQISTCFMLHPNEEHTSILFSNLQERNIKDCLIHVSKVLNARQKSAHFAQCFRAKKRNLSVYAVIFRSKRTWQILVSL